MTGYALPGVTTIRYPLDGESAAEDLAARIVAGDRDAFVAVYGAHFAEVKAFAARVLGSREAAEDVVHDVFLALPKALRSFRGESSLRTYLLSMAVRSARTRYRAALRRRKHEARAADTYFARTAGRPDKDAEQHELARLLSVALDALPVDQRVAFVLCEIEERTSAEVAKILDENPSTIRARVFHARKKLRERLSALADPNGRDGKGERS